MDLASTHLIDASVVAIYLVLTFAFGVFARKLLHSKTDSEEDYFLAGRKMPGWMNGVSCAATSMNSDVAPAYCGMAVVVGLSVSWFYLSRFGLGLLIAGLLFAVRWRQLRISTGPEFFALRFGGRGGRFVRTYSSLSTVFIGMVPWIGAGMLGVHMIFGPIFGIESKAVTLSIILPVLLGYVWISGFAGVLVTDVLQSLVIIGANIMLVVMVLMHFGGPAGLVAAIQAAHPAESGEILSTLPVPGHRVLAPLTVLAWCILPTVGAGGGVAIEGQRLFSCRDTREAAKVCVWSEITLFAMLLLLTLPALGAIVNHPELYHADPAEREKAYGMLLGDYLPVGLLGVALAALLSSVMSTIDSHLNYGAQTLLNDVYRPLIGDPGEKRALWIGRLLMIVILASGIGVVYFSKSLIGIAVILTGVFGSSATFGWGQWWWWRVNIWSWISAAMGGPVVYFSLGFLLNHVDWWQQEVAVGGAAAQSMAMFQAVIAMVISTSIWVTVTLLTKPEDLDVLEDFYRRARPMGLWGPIRKALEQEQGEEDLPRQVHNVMLGGFAAAVLGFSWIALAVLSISNLFVGRYGGAGWMALASVVLALCFKRVFNWHLERLE